VYFRVIVVWWISSLIEINRTILELQDDHRKKSILCNYPENRKTCGKRAPLHTAHSRKVETGRVTTTNACRSSRTANLTDMHWQFLANVPLTPNVIKIRSTVHAVVTWWLTAIAKQICAYFATFSADVPKILANLSEAAADWESAICVTKCINIRTFLSCLCPQLVWRGRHIAAVRRQPTWRFQNSSLSEPEGSGFTLLRAGAWPCGCWQWLTYSAFCGTQNCIIEYTRARHWTLSRVIWIQSIPSDPPPLIFWKTMKTEEESKYLKYK
jgi:hypothetical protein